MSKTQIQIAFNILYLCLGIVGLLMPTWWILLFWFVFAVGNGTIGHRYFAHNNFKVSLIAHWIMALWSTLSAYSPVIYWQVQHRHHHRHTDTDQDIHSPTNGRLMSMIGWVFSQSRIESVYKDRSSRVIHAHESRDPAVRLTSQYFVGINVCFLVLLALIDRELALAAASAFVLEHLRLGLVNLVCHWPGFPGNYRNHDTADLSQNNIVLGILTLGFGWHNNHHADAGQLDLQQRWWEIDIEAQIGKLLSKL